MATANFSHPDFGMAVYFNNPVDNEDEVKLAYMSMELFWEFEGQSTGSQFSGSAGSVAMIAGITVGALAGVALIVLVIVLTVRYARRKALQQPAINLDAPLVTEYGKF